MSREEPKSTSNNGIIILLLTLVTNKGCLSIARYVRPFVVVFQVY